MAKSRTRSSLSEQIVIEDEGDSPPRRTRRKTRNVVVEEVSSSESDSELAIVDEADPADIDERDEDGNGSDESSLLSSPPPEEPKLKRKPGRPRKSTSARTPAKESEDRSASPKPKKEGKGRRGGNKRKHDYEYCLTCANYGRACSGRRESDEGCAVCRDPDKDKGEKLRECHWAQPEKGIFTYQHAREVRKREQAAMRIAQGKRPTKRQQQYLDSPMELPAAVLMAPDPLGLAEPCPAAKESTLPPVTRQLNLTPAPVRAGTNGVVNDDTIVVDTADRAKTGTHKPKVIKLFVKSGVNGITNDGKATYTQTYGPREQPTDANGHRRPYYDPLLNAFILPAYPFSNLLPPDLASSMPQYCKTYISPYDAVNCIPALVRPTEQVFGHQRPQPQQPIISQPGLPPQNKEAYISRPVFSKARALDTRGQPAKKWSRSNSSVKNVGGYELKTKGWRAGATDEDEHERSNAVSGSERLAMSGGLRFDGSSEQRAGSNSSVLSSALSMPDEDANDSMLDLDDDDAAFKENEIIKHSSFNLVPPPLTNGASKTTRTLKLKFSATPSVPINGVTPSRNLDGEPDVSSDKDEDLTSDEGDVKSIPVQLRNGSPNKPSSTGRSASPVKANLPLTNKDKSPSRSSESRYEDAQEDTIVVNTASNSSGWQAVNGAKRKIASPAVPSKKLNGRARSIRNDSCEIEMQDV